MSEDKNKKRPKSKITPFRAYRDDLEMSEIDPFLRESIKKEADEIEARLNDDPNLAGISASDDMFDMIVCKLKADGHWEEEDTDDGPSDDNIDAEFERLFGKTEEEQNDTISKIDTEQEQAAGLTAETERECISENERPEEVGKDPDPAINQTESETESEMESEIESKSEPEGELTKWYQEQPEEVLRLIERGRKAEREEQEKARKKIRRNRLVKRAAATAAVFVVLVSVGFSTEASRGWILKMWDAAMEGFGFKAATDNVGDSVEARVKSEEELSALAEIEEKMGTLIPDFMYLPQEMEFLDSEISDAGWEARLFYIYKEQIFSIAILGLNEEGVVYYTLDDDAILIDEWNHLQDIKIQIWEKSIKEEIKTYVAEFEYKNYRYVLIGKIPLDEMKKILEFLIIL